MESKKKARQKFLRIIAQTFVEDLHSTGKLRHMLEDLRMITQEIKQELRLNSYLKHSVNFPLFEEEFTNEIEDICAELGNLYSSDELEGKEEKTIVWS